ncbi:hypothetical protein [Priestia megaterium]|uniref:hypothetical protein n=1 Tax=Priestia megaterium TaxID=1404 RepID=UPI0023DBD04D|nr:hypothetical protein [Priestia megaterium]MDF2010178.1 hypothetical protein [Priestia megaterium]
MDLLSTVNSETTIILRQLVIFLSGIVVGGVAISALSAKYMPTTRLVKDIEHISVVNIEKEGKQYLGVNNSSFFDSFHSFYAGLFYKLTKRKNNVVFKPKQYKNTFYIAVALVAIACSIAVYFSFHVQQYEQTVNFILPLFANMVDFICWFCGMS